MTKKLNIRPSTGVYATYKNISYDPWTAIAEFVDNSTQSYYDNESKLKSTKYWKGLNVEVRYEYDENRELTLVISDNAYGMDYRDFQRAIVLDSPPKKPTRCEFGMGLKTAACWFGTMWSVESVELGSGIKYKTVVDVESLHKYKNEEIEVNEIECSRKEHGTTIRIWKLNRKIVGKQVKKTKDQLRGMYRQDLRSGKIKISYNDEPLQYEDPEILTEELPDGSKKIWKEKIYMTICHQSKEYHVTGFIAIRKEGSTSGAGFTLLRRGRVIIGGYENCYRPEEIFDKPNSYVYQRLFGELNMDDWPVTQTKDGFDWYNGLEDEFIEKLENTCKDYIKKAKEYRVRKIKVGPTISKMTDTFSKAGIIQDPEVKPINNLNSQHIIGKEKIEGEITYNPDVKDSSKVRLTNNCDHQITFKYNGKNYAFEFSLLNNNPNEDWLTIEEVDTNKFKITLNISHPFFDPYTNDSHFLEIMERFSFAFALAEVDAYSTSVDEKIYPSSIRKRMNKSLESIARTRSCDE